MVNVTDLVDYSRQITLDDTIADRNNGAMDKTRPQLIVGCGGVGFWLGIVLAMQGYGKIVLVEGESIDKSNLNRLPVPPSWIGTNKGVALRKIIHSLRPLCVVSVVPQHYDHANPNILLTIVQKMYSNGVQWMVWDCTDNAIAQKALYGTTQKYQHYYRKIGYEGLNVGTYKEMNVWTVEDYQRGYRTSNACAATSALAAVLGFFAEGLGSQGDVTLDIEDMAGAKIEVMDETDEDEEE